MSKNYEYNKKWRHEHPERAQKQNKRYYAKTTDAPRRRYEWTLDEMKQITAEDRPPDSELSKRLGRSVKAIQGKRNKIRTSENADAG